MAAINAFHGASGASDFLGLRRSRQGEAEIVYDDGRAQRLIWRVLGEVPDTPLREALQSAAAEQRVLPALFAELKRRAIMIEVR